MAKFPKLAGLAEIASLADVSRTRAGQIANHPDFPEPVQRLAMGPVWREADVQKFLATPRKPGRRPKEVSHAGVRLRQERERLGWTLREAEHHTGVPNAHISQIERGVIRSPELATLAPLAAAYGLSLDELSRRPS